MLKTLNSKLMLKDYVLYWLYLGSNTGNIMIIAIVWNLFTYYNFKMVGYELWLNDKGCQFVENRKLNISTL